MPVVPCLTVITEACDLTSLFGLISKIARRLYTTDNWLSILDALSEFFGVDGAFIGLWKHGFVEFSYSSRFIKEIAHENLKVNLKDRVGFTTTLTNRGYVLIHDYETYPYAMDGWKKAGLKSALVVLIRSPRRIFGSLHLVSFSKKSSFDEKTIEVAKAICDTIALELDKEETERKLENERKLTAHYIDMLKTVSGGIESPDKLQDFVRSMLSEIKSFSSADSVSLVFPAEDIYAAIDTEFKTLTYESFKQTPLYDLWIDNITNRMECLKREALKRCPSRIELATAHVIPILSGGKTIALLCIGFRQDEPAIDTKQLDFLKIMTEHFVSLIHSHKNIHKISSLLSATESGLIRAFVSSVEAKDVYTRGHSEHVAHYVKRMAKVLGFNKNEQEVLYNAGLLHDIGKIGVPDNILLKPGKLTPHEYEIMKLHPVFSYEIVKNIPKFEEVAICIRQHHERTDGSGYPDGLSKDQIRIGARMLAIADIFDALTTDRPYRVSISPDKAIESLRAEPVDQAILEKTKKELVDEFKKRVREPIESFVPRELEAARRDFLKRDHMTGLYRREAFVEAVNEKIASGESFAVFMVDIKNISYINYKYGTEIGDKVIVLVAEELNKLKKVKALARTGADVFMFIYTGPTARVFKEIIAKELKKGMLSKIMQKSCIIDKREATSIMGCYITFTVYPDEAQNAEELIYRCIKKKKSGET